MNKNEAREILEQHYHGSQISPFTEALGILLREPESPWTKSTDSLPPEGQRQHCVVILSNRKHPVVWGWMGSGWAVNVSDPIIGSHKNITHWMPLPALPNPPTEEK